MKPIVSIIINNYNYGRYLRDAVDSALDQTYPETEIIVVDDGSNDDSREIISSYGDRIFSLLKANGGQGSCFNAGFKKCKGDIIIFLDADDYLAPEAAEKSVEAFSDRVAKIHWPLLKVDKENKPTGEVIPSDKLAEGDLKEQLIQYGPSKSGGPPASPPTSGNAWSRNFLEKVLPMPEQPFRYGADDYLFVLTPLFGEIKSIHQPLGYYRVHGTNDTLRHDYFTSFFSRYEQCCETLSNFLGKEGINIDPSSWPRDHWYHEIYNDMSRIAQLVPSEDAFILVDENHWLTGETMLGRRRILFTEKNGEYYGPPATDEKAIEELEKDRQQGASYIVFTWPSFWWLDHYKGFHDHLKSNYNCILNDHRMVIYNLNSSHGSI